MRKLGAAPALARKLARAESGVDRGPPVRAVAGGAEGEAEGGAPLPPSDSPLAELGSFARQLGGFVEWHVEEL